MTDSRQQAIEAAAKVLGRRDGYPTPLETAVPDRYYELATTALTALEALGWRPPEANRDYRGPVVTDEQHGRPA